MRDQAKRYWPILLIFSAALGVRLGIVLYLDNYHSPVTWEYGEIAQGLVEGKGFAVHAAGDYAIYQGYRSWIPPLYPSLLAGFIYFGGTSAFLLLELLQAVLGACTCLLIYALGKELFGRSTACVGAIALSFYPPLVIKIAYIDPITIEVLLLVAAFLLLARCGEKPSLAKGIAAGWLLGLFALSRPALFPCAALLFGAWFIQGNMRQRHWRAVVLVFILGFSPWTLRNYLVHQQVVLVSTNGGYNFWIGNNAFATGEAYAADGQPVWTKMPAELKARVLAAGEAAGDRILYKEGMRWVTDNPAAFAALTAKRFVYFWWFRPGAGVGQGAHSTFPASWRFGYQIFYALLLVGAVIGLVLSRHWWPQLLPFYALFAGFTLVYSVFFVHTRYRMVLEPFLIVLAAFGANALAKRHALWQRDDRGE